MRNTTKIFDFKNLIGFLFVCLVLFSSCKKELQQTIENPKFVRTWYDTVQGMPFRAKLSIKENNTFEYSSRSCESGSKSNGTWKIEKNTIILNSIKPKGCLFQHPFGISCIAYNDTTYFENNKTIKNCEPSGREATYEIFENEKFILRNDTLIHTNKVKDNCPNIRIAFSTKEKVRRSSK
jgi:hypothetical protein